MKSVPSCRSLALITAATGTVLVTTAFGVLPATAATDVPEPVSASTVSSPSAPDTVTTGSATAVPSTDQGGAAAAPVTVPSTPAAVSTEAPAPTATATPTATTAPATPAAPATTPAAPGTGTGTGTTAPPATPAAPAPAASGTASASASAPSYSEGTSESSPRVLPTVTAGGTVAADLRAQDARGATYTLTETDGSPARLNEGLTFRNGFLRGTATVAGTFTLRVTATTAGGTATQWIRQTVEPAAVVGVGVVVHGVPAAADGSYTWVEGDQTGSPIPITVVPGGSITLVPWTIDAHGNTVQATDRAQVWASDDADRVEQGPDGFTVTFATAATHTVWVSVDGVCAEFSVAVTDEPAGPTTPTEPTTPADPTPAEPTPADPAPAAPVDTTPQDGGIVPVVRVTPTTSDALAPVATRTTPAHALAYTGADTAAPMGWAAVLLAVGAALLGLRRVRRSRHRA